MITNEELKKAIQAKLEEMKAKEKELYQEALSADTIDDAIELLEKAQSCFSEYEVLEKKFKYLIRAEGFFSNKNKGISLT